MEGGRKDGFGGGVERSDTGGSTKVDDGWVGGRGMEIT